MAREVQLRLLPAAPPTPARAEIAARFMAARSIGGDVYDFLDYGPGRVALAVGDVSGKAAPAALYAALVSGILRSLAPQRLSPAKMLAALNDQLQERPARRAVRHYGHGRLGRQRPDPHARQRRFRPANVRHLEYRIASPMPSRSKHSRSKGFPLGLFPNATYEETVIQSGPGDLFVFFSDGIVDALNPQEEMFGEERLSTLLQHHPTAHTSAEAAVEAILEAVTLFQAGTEHFDDETVVVLRAT